MDPDPGHEPGASREGPRTDHRQPEEPRKLQAQGHQAQRGLRLRAGDDRASRWFTHPRDRTAGAPRRGNLRRGVQLGER